MTEVIQLNDQLFMFDIFEQGLTGRTSAYVYTGATKVLIDTGSAPSHHHLLAGLRALGIDPAELDYVVITHVHLDHGGGAGRLAQVAPKAVFVVHKRGARHLADPSRLIAGARMVYGDAFDTYFSPVLPVPEERILVREEGETLDFGNRLVTFYDTPGHAKHHFSLHDPLLDAVFAGDALGIRYVKPFTKWGFEFVLPSTSPPEFDPDGAEATVQKLRRLHPKTVYHAHFGPSPAEEAFEATSRGVQAFAELALKVYHPRLAWEDMSASLQEHIAGELRRLGHTESRNILDLGIDVELDAKGMLYYGSQRSPSADDQGSKV